jgi:hypothetical protein
MHRHRAVINFAGASTILPRDAGRFDTLFGVSRFINNTDGLLVGVIPSDYLSNQRSEQIFVPDIAGEELLQRAGRDSRIQSDGLDALAWQLTQLAAQIGFELASRLSSPKAVAKLTQKVRQFHAQVSDLVCSHP